MAIVNLNGTASIVRLSFNINELPEYLQRGLDAGPTTGEVERAGQTLIQKGFLDSLSADFVRKVCTWGNYPGIAGKVLKRNDVSTVSDSLRQAYNHTRDGNITTALEVLLDLNGLAVSFASKHLKFLDPTRHVVLDSIISERLGYPRTPNGYCEFASDCAAVLLAAQEAGVLRRDGSPFRVADVEMAIYQILRSSD